MVKICEQFAKEHNIVFSTNKNAKQSKTKCVIFGKAATDLSPIKLDDMDLPWVDEVEHLGHTLHKSMSMSYDARRAAGRFMSRASGVRDELYFAHPRQKMQAIELHCCDGYGAMLWDLSSDAAQSYFKSWNKQARLCWNVDRKTHTNIVEDFLCEGQTSLRNQIFSRYPEFIRKLMNAPGKEIRFLVNLVKTDARSNTCQNIRFLSDIVNDDCLLLSSWNMEQVLPKNTIPPIEAYKKSLLSLLLETRIRKDYSALNANRQQVDEMINSLCIS